MTGQRPEQMEHVRRLLAYWGMLADLCFSDLLLCVAVDGASEGGRDSFFVLDQVRPSTTQTVLVHDQVGRSPNESEWQLVRSAWSKGRVADGEVRLAEGREPVRMQCIPLRYGGRTIAALLRYSAFSVGRRPGELERTYVQLFDRFAGMMVQGTFPFATDDWAVADVPRVGDGVMVLDSGGRVSFASPNAVTALHRLDIRANATGLRLSEVGLDDSAVAESFATALPAVGELEGTSGTIVLLRCLPFSGSGEVRPDGAMVLVRDVTELRRRDRMLLSKDATIREIHHRVKNNLQTISSLLRLQARRVSPGEGRTALQEAERRIASMAVVHDFLARDVADQVRFDSIVRALVHMARESVLPPRRVDFSVEGDAGDLPAGVATPLAVIVSELLQNAVEHGFGDGRPGRVDVRLAQDSHCLQVRVSDNGTGLREGFRIEESASLGLTIVRDLVERQLGGRLELATTGGLSAIVTLPSPQGGEAAHVQNG
ncbi:MAG: sensor histidine kinase [Actinomycetota bacterium]|nr:sensor histidine kinase [Actinomycetota bacterium]